MPTVYQHIRPGDCNPPLPVAVAASVITVVTRSHEPDHPLTPLSEHRCPDDACSVDTVILRQRLDGRDAVRPRCPCCAGPLEFVSFLSRSKMVPVVEGDR
jgi:hypothetical protein